MIKVIRSSEFDQSLSSSQRYDSVLNTTIVEYNPDYYYGSIRQNLLVSDNADELLNFIKTPFNFTTINSGDKVVFHNSFFPSLLLSRINCDIKRTTKPSNKTKIVTDIEKIEINSTRKLVIVLKDRKLYHEDSYGSDFSFFKDSSTDIKRLLEGSEESKFYYAVLVENKYVDIIEDYLQHTNNFVKTKDLILYIWKNLPSPTEEEFKDFCRLLSSSDKESRKCAGDALQYYNLSDYIWDLHKLFFDISKYYLLKTSSWEYLVSLTDETFSRLSSYRIYSNREIQMKCFNNVLNSDISMNKLKEDIKNRIIDNIYEIYQIKEDLDLINCEIKICDKDGEAETGD